MADATLDALHAALDAMDPTAPDAESAGLVLADALIERGDVRGELVRVQHALLLAETEAERSAHQQRQYALIAEHAEHLLGFVPRPEVELTWRFGYVERARVRHIDDLAERVSVLRALLAHPGGRRLRHLHLDGPEQDHVEGVFRDLLAALRSAGITAQAALRTLQLGDGWHEHPGYWVYGYFGECRLADELDDLWDVFPRVEAVRLDLGAANLILGEIRSESLRRFEWVAPYVSSEALEPLASAHWPRLERFVLWTGCEMLVNVESDLYEGPWMDEGEPEDLLDGEPDVSEWIVSDPAQLGPLLDQLDTALGLVELGIANFAGSLSDLVLVCSEHALWRRIRVLDVSHGRLRAEELDAFLATIRGAHSLRRIEADGLRATEAVWEALRSGLGEVVLDGRRERPIPEESFYYVITQE